MNNLEYDRELEIYFRENEDACTNCGELFKKHDKVILGYLSNNKPAVLCEKCSYLIKKTQRLVTWSEREYSKPAPDDKLWRYMDLSKFISLISSNVLYFAAANSFEDPYEGAKGEKKNKEEWDNFYKRFFNYAICNPPKGCDPPNNMEQIRKDCERLLADLSLAEEKRRKNTFISCWHQNDYESEAMWNLYSKDKTNAVAIQTTYKQLYLALYRDPIIRIGKIKYIDFNKQFAPINNSYWYKRYSFEHENEVRAIITDFSLKAPGKSMPINIDILIESIHISPYAPLWFVEVVKVICEQFKLRKPIKYSEMLNEPFF